MQKAASQLGTGAHWGFQRPYRIAQPLHTGLLLPKNCLFYKNQGVGQSQTNSSKAQTTNLPFTTTFYPADVTAWAIPTHKNETNRPQRVQENTSV